MLPFFRAEDNLSKEIIGMTTADILRVLLILDILAMGLLAALYLRRRQLTLLEYLGWGLLAVVLPLLGPFLVIITHPGQPLWKEKTV